MTIDNLVLPITTFRWTTLGRMVFLHLIPGALFFTAILIIAPVAERLGLPPGMSSLIIAALVVGIPFQLGFLYYQGYRLNSKLSLKGIVLYRHSMPWWQYVIAVIVLFAWLYFIWYIIRPPVNQFFIDNFFGWMPGYLSDAQVAESLKQDSKSALMVIGVLFSLAASLGGAIEELYFRGYVLPRMEFLGKWAPAVNIVLFSIYHFWTPWENIPRILAMAPLYYLVWWKRNVYLSFFVHLIINLISGMSLVFTILQLP